MKLQQILDRLDEKNKGAKLVKLTTRTMPKLLKKSRITGIACPYREVVRIAERFGVLACDYGSAVNNQREREDYDVPFVAEALWKGKGRRVKGSKYLVEHIDSGEQYIAFMPHNKDGSVSIGRDLWQDENGNEIDPSLLSEYLPVSSQPNTQETEKEIYWRVIKVENILAIKYGEEYFTFA
jgi:hypothetical protein